MPSFAFWKSSKPDESKSPLLSDAAVAEQLSVIIPGASKAVDLNPGNQDSGVFLFDEDAQEIPGDQTPVIGPTSALLGEPTSDHDREPAQESPGSYARVETSLLDIVEPSNHPQSPALVPEGPSHTDHKDTDRSTTRVVETAAVLGTHEQDTSGSESPSLELTPSAESTVTGSTEQNEGTSPSFSRPQSLVPKESGPDLSVKKRTSSVGSEKGETNIRERDSGAYMCEAEGSPALSRPSSIASSEHNQTRSRVPSLSKPAAAPQPTKSIARLQRPAELNLGFNSATDPAKPRSELDLRYDLIRNSKTQSKAALRSPTQLLQDRLNMSPKKKDIEEKVRIFTPPRPTVNGCLLPGPNGQAEAFTSTSVRAKTEAGGRPAWWCKVDKLVVFDGIEQQGSETRLRTRTSKGLSVARRLGDLETVVIPLDCGHCHEMLNRHEWKYDMRVCKRSVCWDCKERCKWELEQEKMVTVATPRADVNRERADSMLQDENRDHVLRKEISV